MRAPPTVHLLIGAYAVGLVAALAWRPSGVGAALLVSTAALWALTALLSAAPKRGGARCRRGQAAALIALAPLVVVAGLCVGGARLTARAQSRLTGFVGETVALRATAVTLPKTSSDRVSLDVKVTSVAGRRVAERAPLTLDLCTSDPPSFTSLGPLVEGTRLALRAQVQALPVVKPGAFDYGRYLERGGGRVGPPRRSRRCTSTGVAAVSAGWSTGCAWRRAATSAPGCALPSARCSRPWSWATSRACPPRPSTTCDAAACCTFSRCRARTSCCSVP